MHSLIKYVGIALLVMGLTACDNSNMTAPAGGLASSDAQEQNITLLEGKLSFTLPADMADQSGSLGTQSNNMHVYSDTSGQKAVIVIIGDTINEEPAELAQRLEKQQRSHDPQLQVVTSQSINLQGHNMWRLDSIISAQGRTSYSCVILGQVDNKLLTLQITLPVDNQQQAQNITQGIINTIVIR